MKNVVVKPDITYFKDEKNDLKLDVYLPPGLKKTVDGQPLFSYPKHGKVNQWKLIRHGQN